jgi:hypothetical protein
LMSVGCGQITDSCLSSRAHYGKFHRYDSFGHYGYHHDRKNTHEINLLASIRPVLRFHTAVYGIFHKKLQYARLLVYIYCSGYGQKLTTFESIRP